MRFRFPALSRNIYLNTAGGAPIPDVAHEAASGYYREAFEDGDIHWNTWLDRTDAARKSVGELVGSPAEHVGFVGNASMGLNLAASMAESQAFAHAPSEFPSCTLPWLRRGSKSFPWGVASDGSFDADDVHKALNLGADTVVVSWVQFGTGFRADLASISAVCKTAGVRLVVDATQAVAAFPIDAAALGIDVLVFSGYKWLTSGYGVAGLVTPRGLKGDGSPFAGWRSQENPFALVADRLEPNLSGLAVEAGHPPFPGVFAMGASARMWNEAGCAVSAATILDLMGHLHARMDEIGVPVLSARAAGQMSGIALVGVDDAAATAQRLSRQGIITSARGAGLRVSVHAYNEASEIDQFAEALNQIVSGRKGAGT